MLPSSTAEAMYWCGRYVERAQALARVISSYQRLGMDLPSARALDLKPLLALVGHQGTGALPASRAGQLQALVFDEHNPSSVLGALGAARENLRNARVVAPPELWLILNDVYKHVYAARGRSEVSILEALEQTLAAAQRFDGQRGDCMLRDPAHAFLTIGCHLERADMLLRTLGALGPVLRPQGWERAFDDVRWTGILNALGLTSTYRRVYQLNADLVQLLAHVLLREENPRSVAYCVRAIERELRYLPRAGRVRVAVAGVEREGAALSLSKGEQLGPDLECSLPSLGELHDALQATYFPAPSEASFELEDDNAEPASDDPFGYLAREHHRAHGILGLLDEMANRVASGETVEPRDLALVVRSLREFSELDHHEKEETILTPTLVAAGFDWYDGPLAAMRREHRQENHHVRVLSELTSRADAWAPETARDFVQSARDFCRFMRSHMDREQRDLFDQASRTLTNDGKNGLLIAFTAFDAKRHLDARHSQQAIEQLLDKYRPSTT